MTTSSAFSALDRQRLTQYRVRQRLDAFVQAAFVSVHGAPLEDERYIAPLCYAVQSASQAKTSRLLVTIPPRHLKSFSTAVCLPAYLLGLDPALKIAVAVYGEELAREHMSKVRTILDERWFRTTFPAFKLASQRLDAFQTRAGGSLRYVSVGGAFTGLGINLLIIDDILKAQDAGSAALRDQAERYVRQTCMTRFDDARTTRIIAILQRLHLHDLPSVLVEMGFDHLNLPSVIARNLALPSYGGGKEEWQAGDLLAPKRFPREQLSRLQAEMGTAAFSAQYLQEPVAGDGMIVDFSRVRFVDKPLAREDIQYAVMSIDPAVKIHEDCDFTAISIFAFKDGVWRLQDLVEKRLDFTDLKQCTLALQQKWTPDVILIEDCHSGVALWHELHEREIVATVWPVDGDKADRLAVALDTIYEGTLCFTNGEPWSETPLKQLKHFPDGHDDVLDTISQFVAWLRSHAMDSLLDCKRLGRPSGRGRRQRNR